MLDVTKPPFNAKGDGKTDDTQALCDAMRFVRDHYEDLAGEGYSYCSYKFDRNWIIYLPNGEYLVSNTVSQGWPARAYDIKKGWANCGRVAVASPEAETPELELRGERNYGIRVVGQSRQGTVIRLKDQCPGFEKGKENALLQFYLLKNGSSINQGNYAQNLTLYTGKGNPGAVGMKWNAANWGGIHNVAIRSGDGSGRAGLMMDRRNAHGYQHDIVVDGFDVGVEMAAGAVSVVVLEYATLTNQRQAAIRLKKNETFCGRKLLIRNAPMALRAAGSVACGAARLRSRFREERRPRHLRGGRAPARTGHSSVGICFRGGQGQAAGGYRRLYRGVCLRHAGFRVCGRTDQDPAPAGQRNAGDFAGKRPVEMGECG